MAKEFLNSNQGIDLNFLFGFITILINRAIYDGEFKDGMKDGYGKMTYPNGNYYEGEWSLDKKEGQGTMHWININEKVLKFLIIIKYNLKNHSIQVLGLTTSKTGSEPIYGSSQEAMANIFAIDMKGNGRMAFVMDMESFITATERSTKVNGSTI